MPVDHSSCKSLQHGFSLVELMVTLVVMSLLVLVAVPGMLDLFRDASLSAQTDMLVSTLSKARIEAIKRRIGITVCPMNDPNAGSCSANAADWSSGFGISDGTNIIQRIQAKNGLTISTTATSVVFTGTIGNATTATFTLCASGRKQQQVNVAISGRVSKQINTTVCS